MILCVGEILIDMFGIPENGSLKFEGHLGGASINVAVNAKQAGAKVGYVGRVGNDAIGRYLISEVKRAKLDYVNVQEDSVRNTTMAIVTLNDGERSFEFFRNDTADYNIDANAIFLDSYDGLNIVHMSSLILNEKRGRDFAFELLEKTRQAGKLFSFDVNFRLSLYKNTEEAVTAVRPFAEKADILKLSEEELLLYTGASDLKSAVNYVSKPNKLLLITLGERGSMFSYNGVVVCVPTLALKPVDTTGAGDAFMGALLAYLDGKKWSEEVLTAALVYANKKGAETTQFKGAVRII